MSDRDVPAEPSTDDAHTRTVRDPAQPRPPGGDSEGPTVPGHGRAAAASSRFSPGAHVGRYQILAVIGEGGMGRVLRAHDVQLGRDIALKVVSRPTREGRARLLREARSLARIAHPNVVPIFDVGTVGDEIYMAMELVDGCDAKQWLRTPRSWQQVLDVFLDAGRGLRAVHAAGIVHRDFKPENVMIGRDGRARVTDFGLALRDGGQPPEEHDGVAPATDGLLTATGAIAGTPAYMAPEQAVGGEVDHRTDQFGFCVSLFEGLFGTHPFDGTTADELLASTSQHRVRKLDGADVPKAIWPILVRGLDPDPRRRWAGLDTLLAALARCRARPRRAAVPVVVLSVIVVAVVVVGLWIARATRSKPVGRSVPAPAVASPSNAPVVVRATRITTGTQCEEYPAFSPDNRLIAFDSNRSGDWEVFTIDRQTAQLRQVTREPGWDYMPRFSPDGTRLAYLHQGDARELRVIRLDEVDRAPHSLGEVMGAYDWLDASTLVAAAPGGSMVRIGLDGARADHRRLPEPEYIAAIRHHRGDIAVITEPELPPHLFLLRGAAAPRDLTPRHVMSIRSLGWRPDGDGLYFNGRDALGTRSLYWRAFAASEEISVNSPPPGDGLDVASDGSALVMSSCRTQLRLVRLRRGQPAEPLFDAHDWDEFEPAPAGNGRMLITSTLNALPEVRLIDLVTGEGSPLSQEGARQGTMAPDNTRIAYLITLPTNETNNGLWIADSVTRTRKQLTHDETDRSPTFSHDSRWLYMLRGSAERSRVYRISVDGGAAEPLTPPGTVAFTVSPTADELVYISGEQAAKRLHRGRVAGPFTLIESLPTARYSEVQFSPDGQKLVVNRDPGDLIELTVRGAKRQVVRSASEILQDVIYAPDGDGFIGALQAQKGNLFVLDGRFP